MTQQEWDEMNNKEKHEFLTSNVIEMEKHNIVYGCAKATPENPVITYYKCSSGGIEITGWHELNSDAAKSAAKFIEDLLESE